MKAEEILRKYVTTKSLRHGEGHVTDEEWKDFMENIGGDDVFIPAMKEYAEYIAKCAHRDLRRDLVDKFNTHTEDDSLFEKVIMNHQFVKPKELE